MIALYVIGCKTFSEMFGRRPEIRERLLELAERFRQRGATRPERAVTLEEPDLPTRLRNLVSRRMGRLGIFVEIDGRYYLSEKRLREIQEPRRARKRILTLRTSRMFLGILLISLLLINLFVKILEIRLISSAFLVLMLRVSVLQIYCLIRVRRRL